MRIRDKEIFELLAKRVKVDLSEVYRRDNDQWIKPKDIIYLINKLHEKSLETREENFWYLLSRFTGYEVKYLKEEEKNKVITPGEVKMLFELITRANDL